MKAKGKLAKKVIYAVPVVIAALTLLSFSPPAQASSTDSSIESAAMNSHVFTSYLKDDAITVESRDGEVILTGSVATKYHKSMAGGTVANLPEVKSVDNQLEIKGEAPAEMADAWLLTKVKTTLLLHRSVNAGTEVDVKDSIVILGGVADNQAQKELTTEYATDIAGVKEVKNEMTLATPSKGLQTINAKIDDASITTMVKMTLLSHRSTSAFKTSVKTRDAVVTLSGKAENQAEIVLAGKLSKDVNGVQSVQNNMTVR